MSVFQYMYLFLYLDLENQKHFCIIWNLQNIWTFVRALGWLSLQNQHLRFNLTCLCFSICICFCIWTKETKNSSASFEICKISGPSLGLLADKVFRISIGDAVWLVCVSLFVFVLFNLDLRKRKTILHHLKFAKFLDCRWGSKAQRSCRDNRNVSTLTVANAVP